MSSSSNVDISSISTDLLSEQIRVQAEYLFSPANLSNDKALRELMEQDASRQGACNVNTIIQHAPRLGSMVAEVAKRNHQNDGAPRKAANLRAFVSSIKTSKTLVMNPNNGTVKRNMFLPAPPPLFNPDDRPLPESDLPLSPVPAKSPRRIHPRIWFEGVEGWEEEYHANPSASSRPIQDASNSNGSKLVWRPVTQAERERFKLADYVIKKLWTVDLPPSSGEGRHPAIDQWELSEFFMSADQLRRLEAKRQFASMWRGESKASQRLVTLRTGTVDPPDIPSSFAGGDQFGLLNLLDGKGDGDTIEEGTSMLWLKEQLKFWRVDEKSKELNLASHDLDPEKVTALAAFIGGSRNCERVDIRANPRLTAHHGVIIAKALMRNFNSIPSPIFLTQAPPLPPPISDEDEIEERVRLEGEALVALRNASEGTAVAAELGYCLQKCYDLGMQPNTDIERAQQAYVDRLSKVGTRCPNKGSILWFNNMSVHTLRSGTAKVVDANNYGLGAADVTILLELLSAPFIDPDELAKVKKKTSQPIPMYRDLSPSLFIEELNLSGNEGMSDGGAGALAAAIGSHCLPILKSLLLSGCGIGPIGFKSLSSALRLYGDLLEELDLGKNRGGPSGLTELVEHFLFPRNTMPLFASARDVANNCRPNNGESVLSNGEALQNGMTEAERGYHKGMGGSVRTLNLKKLNLSQDVGSFSERGEDMSGVETLAACLVHPDAACVNLDILVLGGAAIPVLHLKGEAIEKSSPEANAAALTFMPGNVDVPSDPFAAENTQAGYNMEFSGPSRATSRQSRMQSRKQGTSSAGISRTRSRNTSSKGGRFYAETSGVSSGLVEGVNAVSGMKGTMNSGSDDRGDFSGLENDAYLDSSFRQVDFGPLHTEDGYVRKSDVRDRLKERIAKGPMLRSKAYPITADNAGAEKGKAIGKINMSLQGTVISVEDAIVIGALVEENDKIDTLHLNSHRALPIKQLRGDDDAFEEILDFSNCYWNAQEILVAARLLRYNRRVKTLRLCDNKPCNVVGNNNSNSYRQAGLGDLALTLTPPIQGLPGAQLSVVGRKPPRGAARRRGGGDLAHLVGIVPEAVLREGRPPLFDKTNWFTACRPDFVDLSNCEIMGASNEAPLTRQPINKNDLSPAALLAPVLRGIYAWGLEHTLSPDSLVLIRKDKMSQVDAAIRMAELVPSRLTSPYSPYRKERAKRGGVRHLNALPSAGRN